MNDNELEQFAAKFISLWQENFSKAIADGKIIESMMQAAGNMQQFYDKQTNGQTSNGQSASTFPSAFKSWDNQHGGGDDAGRIDVLEQRVSALEKGRRKAAPKNKSGS